MKEQQNLAQTLHKTKQTFIQKFSFQNQIDSLKQNINQIRTKHQNKLRNSEQQIQEQSVLHKTKNHPATKIQNFIAQKTHKISQSLPKEHKNVNISDTDKMLFQKKFKNFLNHRQAFEEKAKQRREKIIAQRKKRQQGNLLNEQQFQAQYMDKDQILKDTQGQNQFQNAQDMIAFYEEITFGKKNKRKDVHLYHAQKIQYLFRREQFDHLVIMQIGNDQRDHQNQLPTLTTSIKKDTFLNYLFDEPSVMMLYSINPYHLGDELAQFQTSNNGYLTFQDFSNFLLLDRQPTYFQYSRQNLQEARKIGRGIKCQPIISKWVSDQETYEWLIQLFRNVDILGQQKADRQVLARKIRKQAQKKRLLDQEIIQIVNINKLITLDRILYEIQYCTSDSSKITLSQFKSLLKNYKRLSTPQKDKLITKLILSGKYDPSYIFILGTQTIQIIKETFKSIQKFAEYFVPKQKFVQKLVKNPKFNKIRNQFVRSQGNRYVKKQNVQQTLARFLNQAEIYVDIQQVLQFFTNRGRPRKVQHSIYLANLQIQIARIQQQEKRKQEKKLSSGDYSTSSDEQEFQKAIKQKSIQRKKQKLASIRAAQNFTQGKKFNVTVPNAFSFGDGVKQKNKVSIRQKKLKDQLEEKRRQQLQSMQPIKPKPVPEHVKQDLYEKITKEQERQRKQRLERFRLQSQQNMYPISPHLLSKPKSKSVYEQQKTEYRFIAKPLPWYCQVNLMQRIQKEKDERRQRILQQIINKHNDEDLPQGFKKMIQRGQQTQNEKQRALSKTTADMKQCTFNPHITQSIPDFQMIHEHLRIDLENKKQQKKPIQILPFSFQNRPHRSRTAVEPRQKTLHHLKKSKQTEVNKQEEELINIPITQKHLALINLRKKQEQEKFKKIQEQKRASTVRKMRQQKFAPYVRQVLRKSRVGDVAHSRALIQSKIKQFKKQQRKRKRQYEEEMIKIYTKVFNRPLLVEGEGENRHDEEDQHHQQIYRQSQNDRLESRGQKRKGNTRDQIDHFAEDYEMPHAEQQYSKRNPQQQEYDDMRRKAIEHPPRNYLMQEPEDNEHHHEDQQEYDGEYLSENGRYTN